jgi:hypothetical protein
LSFLPPNHLPTTIRQGANNNSSGGPGKGSLGSSQLGLQRRICSLSGEFSPFLYFVKRETLW